MRIVDYKSCIRQIYSPPKSKENINQINSIFDLDKTRFYSYGRFALYHGLKSIGLKEGDEVLIPSFICRDVLSAINQLSLSPIYYDVDIELKPQLSSDCFKFAKAILIVNYFGFPQNLELINEYIEKNKCILIEDNAHGFLSCDSQGKYLGTRGDMGIFSIRKTIPLFHGAALYMKDKSKIVTIPEQLEFYDYNSFYYNCKEVIRKVFPLIGISGVKIFSIIIRTLRKFKTGSYIPVSNFKDEIELPLEIKPVKNLIYKINTIDLKEETNRRRAIYKWLQDKLSSFEVKPVFVDLPMNCVPYTFPFYCYDGNINIIKKELSKFGLEIFNWPALPEEIQSICPKFYKSIWCVRFLW